VIAGFSAVTETANTIMYKKKAVWLRLRNGKVYGFSSYRWIIVSEWAMDRTNRIYFVSAYTVKFSGTFYGQIQSVHSDQLQLFSAFVFPCGLAAGCLSAFLNNPELYNCHGTVLTHTLVIYKDLHSGTYTVLH